MISTWRRVSVPIVSQTDIDPMKTALSLMLALVTTTALGDPFEAAGAGRLVPAWLPQQRLALHPVATCRGCDRQAKQWFLPVRMDCERKQLLLAQRPTRLDLCILHLRPQRNCRWKYAVG
jgi:hypothetical protein